MLSVSQSNAQCTAMFMYWGQSTNPPALVNFMDSSVISSGPAIYLWDFGDGSGASTIQNPQFIQ